MIEPVKANMKKSELKSSSPSENHGIDDAYLETIVYDRTSKNYIEITMQVIPFDKTVRTNTILDLKRFNLQSSAKQAKK